MRNYLGPASERIAMTRFEKVLLTIVESLVLLGIPLIGRAALISAGLVALLLATHLLMRTNPASWRGWALRADACNGGVALVCTASDGRCQDKPWDASPSRR